MAMWPTYSSFTDITGVMCPKKGIFTMNTWRHSAANKQAMQTAILV